MTFSVKSSKQKNRNSFLVGKIKLTKEERKRTFYLPIENTIYVPSTYGVKDQKKISNKEMNKRVNEVRSYLSNKFGGYTSVDATGGYVLKDGKLVKEKVVKVTSFSTKKDFNKNEPELINQVGEWGNSWKQESISYENEGDLFIIQPKKIKK
jgi:hypothetical protein